MKESARWLMCIHVHVYSISLWWIWLWLTSTMNSSWNLLHTKSFEMSKWNFTRDKCWKLCQAVTDLTRCHLQRRRIEPFSRITAWYFKTSFPVFRTASISTFQSCRGIIDAAVFDIIKDWCRNLHLLIDQVNGVIKACNRLAEIWIYDFFLLYSDWLGDVVYYFI
jgi:hypothetical protein